MRFPLNLFIISALLFPALAVCQYGQLAAEPQHRMPLLAQAETEPGSNKGSAEGVIDLRSIRSLDSVVSELADSRVIYVGEAHDDYAHHLQQLRIIRKLHAIYPDIAIGMEQFQSPYQPFLDDYIAGRLSEKEMLRKTEWYRRWRFDYRLYQPILSFAREQGIPIVALNVPKEIADKVAQQGMESLTPEERALLPSEIDRSDLAYRDRLMEVFKAHPHAGEQQFERFLQVQLLWDEGMAQRVVDHLQQHTGRKMVVLAGSGHLSYGSGIPKRVARRLPAPNTIIIPADAVPTEPAVADLLLITGGEVLEPAGVMGVLLEERDQGVAVQEVIAGSAAEAAGIQKDDLILTIEGSAVDSTADVKIEMLGRKPGDRVRVSIQRRKLMLLQQERELELILGP
jgi:uncharacterized iron-regulated protein